MQNFKTFTPEVMANLRRAMHSGRHQRHDALAQRCHDTRALLAAAQENRAASESERRMGAAQHSSARQTLRSALHEQMSRFKDGLHVQREEIAADLRTMADELRAAQSAFRGDPDQRSE